MTKSKFTLVVAIAVASLVAADTSHAFAKGNRNANGRARRNVDTVRMAPPADGVGDGARGNITITHGRRGDDAVLHVKGLDRRTSYDVVNGQTGDVLGTLRTNRRGIGTFDLTPGLGKRAARATEGATGENAGDVPEIVDVVDPDTGDPVLTGDTTGDLQALYGYATVGNATESATITLGSDPFSDSQYLSFSYFAEPSADGWTAGVYELYTDTAGGDELPLGKTSVLDLAGLRFQVRNGNGDTVFKGTLPDVEAYAIDDPSWPGPNEPLPEDPFGYGDDGVQRDENASSMPFGFPSGYERGDAYSQFTMNGFVSGGQALRPKTARDEPVADDPPAAEFTLWLESADGFAKAGDLSAPDYGGGCHDAWDDSGDWEDYGDWNWDWSWDWGGDWSEDWSDDWTWYDDSGNGDGTTTGNTARNGRRP